MIYSKQLDFRQGANEPGEGIYTQYMTDAERVCNTAESLSPTPIGDPNAKSRFDVAVVGAGIIGLTSALSMSQRGQRVALFDQRATSQMTRTTQRVYALNKASLSLLNTLNVPHQLPIESMTPYIQMHVWVAASLATISFDARDLGHSQLGAILPENSLIHNLLTQALNDSNITFIPSTTIKTIEEHASHVELLSEDARFQAQLLMIADGPHSPLRHSLNLPITQWSYRQDALVATVQTELAHEKTCYQIFTPEGPLAFLPLHDPHQCSIVWSTSPAYAKHLLSLSDERFNDLLTEQFQYKLGHTQRLTSLDHFPLTMRHVKQYVSTRYLILGDAAHSVHPMAGLGLNIGLADLNCWLKHYDKFGFARLTRALNAYQRERKVEVWKIILMLDGLKMLFSQSIFPLQQLRDIGINGCNMMPMIKRFFMKQAQQT
jgi:2-polyprenylphenol 6-hydroxylase